ncbi:hypothetical protein AB0L06_39565 [Spirillospora sp. NPDC052269]
MSDVMLPWPEPRRPRKDGEEGVRKDAPKAAPHYELRQVLDDGSAGPVEVLPIVRPPWEAKAGRRGFLGAGIASSVAAALLLSACGDRSNGPSGDTDSPGDSGGPSDSPSDTPYSPPDSPYSPPQYTPPANPPDNGGGGVGGGRICTCNKVCTCIPVCQAHRLLDGDPVVRRMAETVIVAMGPAELAYLRWAADEADEPLRARIGELIAEVEGGRVLQPGDLSCFECAPYADSDDPVVALMAAQVLMLRALSLGTGLTGGLAVRTAEVLRAGKALHTERAPAWSGA